MTHRFYLETYGCSLNTADSDIIVGRLQELKIERVQEIEDADLIILNSCGVKEPTEDRIIHRLEELAREKNPVVVTGCLPRISLARVERAIPEYAAILGPQSIESLASVILRVLEGERGIQHLDSDEVSKLKWFAGPPESVICTVPICEGCLGNCTYCAVKFARGQVKSYSIEDINLIIERCVHLGYQEIRLTSQDAAVYGSDTGETLASLLHDVGQIEGTHKFRLGMFNPNLVLDSIDGILQAMDNPRFFKFFHIPLQTGSDNVLSAMKRRYTVAEWEGVVRKIRDRFRDATIATDVIVGFPNESDSDFEQTLEVINRIRPSVVNISKYGDRPGTLASKSKDKVDTHTKKQRSRTLTSLVNEILTESNESWVGWSGSVILTEKGSTGGLVGRNESYKTVIVHDDLSLGTTVDVEITSAKRTHLNGEIKLEI
ncbi:MAG: tRNA (N(6)-L-threonylcarbamoyladenosine(37)-C(2))-methylthiotransferase [Candidatus Thorarchaeota archaeon]|nr:MAG: tRNA (N(6)-L-threonylcarbamoyladenosine(37)-C(2))-methylthiotransferase [Candidatus Thorarchaeota archaeon]